MRCAGPGDTGGEVWGVLLLLLGGSCEEQVEGYKGMRWKSCVQHRNLALPTD